MAIIDLSDLNWTLAGWRPQVWRCSKSMETGVSLGCDVGPVPAKVPGSVHQALLDAGILPNWNEGANSRSCEWVEHRHWYFETVLPAGFVPQGERVCLDAKGLDYSGWLLIDGVQIAEFTGALIPHRFDLTSSLADGIEHRLGIMFDEPPAEQGQFGYTSRSRYFKSRYNYSWDWCPRIVPVGVWDTLELRTGTESLFHVRQIDTDLDRDNKTGRVRVRVEAEQMESAQLSMRLRDAGHEIARTSGALGDVLELAEIPVEAWWPNGEGESKTYDLEIVAQDEAGETLWSVGRTIGFKRVEWRPCQDAPEDAEPWVCVVNGRPVFLQGANWVPPRACYADTTDEEYGRLIALYKEMGTNILRVWGGAILEKEVFYDLCDRAGILVWQEFPLSSSGVENEPPTDEAAIAQLTTIASSYIERRRHHVSLAVWCGGNELISLEMRPIGYDHPCIAALKELVEREDPSRRFLPTSPSGPRCWGGKDEYGAGVHHDVHGPWGLDGTGDMDGWRAYWSGDDALFRSEVGVPGASPSDMIEQYAGPLPVWPPTNEYWNHSSSWWIQWDRVKEAMEHRRGQVALTEYVRLTQEIQAEGYAVAARACKRRFPACGGFIIWMGHDCFPCPANNSVIDFHRDPKPAFHALKDVFTRSPFEITEEE